MGRKSKSEKKSSQKTSLSVDSKAIIEINNENNNQQIDLYRRSNNIETNQIDFEKKSENLVNRPTSSRLSEFQYDLNFHEIFQNPKFHIKKYHFDFNLNPELNFKHDLIMSFISDKLYQAHVETNMVVANQYDRAIELIKSNNNKNIFLGHDADIRDVWYGFTESAVLTVRDLIRFSKMVPGLDRLSENDFKKIMNEKLFYYVLIKNSKLVIDDESYMIMPNNIQYSKAWFIKTVGIEMTNKLFDFYESFNNLNLTLKEISALVPYIITLLGNFLHSIL